MNNPDRFPEEKPLESTEEEDDILEDPEIIAMTNREIENAIVSGEIRLKNLKREQEIRERKNLRRATDTRKPKE